VESARSAAVEGCPTPCSLRGYNAWLSNYRRKLICRNPAGCCNRHRIRVGLASPALAPDRPHPAPRTKSLFAAFTSSFVSISSGRPAGYHSRKDLLHTRLLIFVDCPSCQWLPDRDRLILSYTSEPLGSISADQRSIPPASISRSRHLDARSHRDTLRTYSAYPAPGFRARAENDCVPRWHGNRGVSDEGMPQIMLQQGDTCGTAVRWKRFILCCLMNRLPVFSSVPEAPASFKRRFCSMRGIR